MSASDVSVGCRVLTASEKISLLIDFMHFFLYNTGQFPDFNLLTSKTSVNTSTALSIVSTKKLQSCLDSVSLLEEELRCLSSSPVEQFLFVLGPNVHKPLRMVILDFRNCSIDHISSKENGPAENVHEKFSNFFRCLTENPLFGEIFASTSPTRLHVYFRTNAHPACGDFAPKMNFKPLSRSCSVHVLNVLSESEELYFNGTGDRSERMEELLRADDDMLWFSCSKVVTGC